jgi:hypothetical protein
MSEMQTQEKKILTKEQLDAISAGARIEQQHKPSAEFEAKWARAKEAEIIGLKSLGKNIMECYNQGIKDGNSPEVSRAITVGRFARYRSVRRIVFHLPQESRDPDKIPGANATNAKRERVKRKILDTIKDFAGEDYKVTDREIKMIPQVVKALRAQYKDQHPTELLQEAAKMVVNKDLPNQDQLLIIGPLDAPNAGTTDSIWSIRMNHLWKDGKPAFLGVTPQGRIELVDSSKIAIEKRMARTRIH